MVEEPTDAKVSYPYMSASQWFGIRTKMRASLPTAIGVDWIMAALGGSEKGARNLMPQLKAVGLIASDGKPSSDLAHDLRDDDSYPEACKKIRERLYPTDLLSSWDDPAAQFDKVATWFMRNARTGEATARQQAKFYLLLLNAELPRVGETAKAAVRKSPAPAKKAATAPASKKPAVISLEGDPESVAGRGEETPSMSHARGPNLHIDVQIHISADATDTQIDSIFASMAKHLYSRG